MMTIELLREHQDVVYALCWRVLRHRQDAEDAAQEALLKIARQAESIEDPARLRAWIHRVALNAATDLARRRRTRAGYETRKPPLAPAEDPVAVHQAVADLPDPERAAVVEHFFHRRTLREIADEEGVTEQAVWKRVERAKHRLRGALALGAAALSFLDAPTASAAPTRDLAAAALGAKAGVSKAVLLGAPAALAVVVGAFLLAKPAAPPPPERPVAAARRESPSPRPTPVAAAPAAAPPPAAQEVAARKPYPLALPPETWAKARAETFRRLRTRKVSIDMNNVPMRDMLADLGRLSGETIAWSDAEVGGEVSYKVSGIPSEGALTLLLKPRELAFDIQDDGTIRVARPASITPGRLDEVPRIESALNRLGQAERRLAGGWDGLDPRLEAERRAEERRARMHDAVVTPKERLEVLGSILGLGVADSLDEERRARLTNPTDLGAGDATTATHLDRLCAVLDAGWYAPHDGLILVVPPALARKEREIRAGQMAQDRALAERLDLPLPDPRPATFADLQGPASRLLRAKAHFSEAAWAAPLSWPPGARGTLREALDASGFRWALYQGDLFVAARR